ncbi:MAG: hypothetical protein HY431_01875 [Candidatus Levybacteria bacterium]|nr:hypothetical protein [Candidatus Levybacteria bacterium]
MNKNTLMMLSGWILVLGGFALAYRGITGNDIIETLFGSLEAAIDVVVFGGAAVVMTYEMLTKKKK